MQVFFQAKYHTFSVLIFSDMSNCLLSVPLGYTHTVHEFHKTIKCNKKFSCCRQKMPVLHIEQVTVFMYILATCMHLLRLA